MKITKMKMRVLMAVLGVMIGGFSVGLFKAAFFGTDPFQCFMGGLANIIPIGFGTLYMIVNVMMLAFAFFFGRHYIGIATFVNIFILGYIIEFSEFILHVIFGDVGMMGRIIFIILGIVILCFASAFYFTANLGVSTYDAVALIMADRKIAKFRFCRIGTDLICVLIGFLFHATIGVGTLITAFCMGPLIDFFRVKISDPLLAKFE